MASIFTTLSPAEVAELPPEELAALTTEDWAGISSAQVAVLSAEPLLANTADGYAPKPDYRPLTKFENRGIKLGHGVWDLVFKRV